jgi:predicted esterase
MQFKRKHLVLLIVVFIVIALFFYIVRHLEQKLLLQPLKCYDYKLLENSILSNNKEIIVHPETHSHWIRKKDDNDKVIVYCHGNSGNLNTYMHYIERFFNEGFDVLAIEYHGFGMNYSKKSSSDICIQNTIDAYLWMENIKKYNRKFFVGFSLGGSIATQTLYRLDDSSIQGLVLVNTFSSFKNLVKDMIGNYSYLLPLSYYKLDTCLVSKKLVNQNPCLKVFIMHNMQDTFIPFQHSMDLYNAFFGLSRKQILIKQGDHNLGPIQYFEEWFPFFGVFMKI